MNLPDDMLWIIAFKYRIYSKILHCRFASSSQLSFNASSDALYPSKTAAVHTELNVVTESMSEKINDASNYCQTVIKLA